MSGPTEPSAEMRQMASTMWQSYAALVAEGFSPDQAMQIISSIVAAGAGKGP